MSILGPIQWVDWYRVKKRFFTTLVWLLLAGIPGIWGYLYWDELLSLVEGLFK